MLIPYRDSQGKPGILDMPNFEYLPLFYQFPKELLMRGAEYLLDMPRHPARILNDPEWFDVLTSDAFLSVVLDGSAYLVWPAFEVKGNLESFSGYDPLWKLARAIQLWEEALEIYTRCKPIDLLYMDQRVDFPWLTLEHSTLLLPSLAYRAIDRHGLRPLIDAVKEMRCIEDFDDRASRVKIDFHRKWYHTQTKHPMVSLEALLPYQQDGGKTGAEALDAVLHLIDETGSPEERICDRLAMEAFIKSLSKQEQEILLLRYRGFTQSQIAEKLNYQTHSAVSKRMAAIKTKYAKFNS